ncbi:4Fe-4S dicluster domain-containing protein [Desulfovibrio oxyclinae]|jgi:Fe-S-cluster-containing dehydrogenase component|uniref:4Fe-4S dicluster domain-containing protein n=1 Tax=Desulfovibrio oxyclinae TaxID=63560 RepID=UPI00039B506F|nr:4Fe-4S dicluster domain-containing protein [Desulfovibrio oxyclinae]
MKKQYAFRVDAERCIGCFTCAMACKSYYQQVDGVIWRQVYPLDEEIYPHRERAFLSLACNHCEDPACLNVCPVVAYTKRDEDGVVVHHQEKCIGCGNCIRSCPYGVPKYNPVEKRAEKCSFCHERLDAGLEPACIMACPTEALQIVDLAKLEVTNEVQYPAGYPKMEKLNPSTRFILPKAPKMVRR